MKQTKGKQGMPPPLPALQGPSPPPRPLPRAQQELFIPLSPRPQHPGLCPPLLPALTILLSRAPLTPALPSSPLSLPLSQPTEIATQSLVSQSRFLLGLAWFGFGWWIYWLTGVELIWSVREFFISWMPRYREKSWKWGRCLGMKTGWDQISVKLGSSLEGLISPFQKHCLWNVTFVGLNMWQQGLPCHQGAHSVVGVGTEGQPQRTTKVLDLHGEKRLF